MTVGQFAKWCVLWLDRGTSDAQFKRMIQEARPLLQYSTLWQAARDAVKRGHHDGACDNTKDETGPCSIHLATGRARRDRLIAELFTSAAQKRARGLK